MDRLMSNAQPVWWLRDDVSFSAGVKAFGIGDAIANVGRPDYRNG